MTFTVHVDQTFVRDELEFAVRIIEGDEQAWGSEPLSVRRPNRWQALTEVLGETERPTIIYTMSRADAEQLADELAPLVGPCLAYHAGLSPDNRRSVEEQFLDGNCDVIVATNAFGMGIDKSDIRSVIHWSTPASPEALYQEAGRAGRGASARRAQAVLLFHPADLTQAYQLIRRDVPLRWEIERTDRALRELADLQQRSVVTVTDDDLRRLASLRPELSVRVVLAHLERAGLILGLDRHYMTIAVRREDAPAAVDLTNLEDALLSQVPVGPESVTLSATALVGLADSTRPRDVLSALSGLVRKGLLEQERTVSIRLLDADPGELLKRAKHAANHVWSRIDRHRKEYGRLRFHRSLGVGAGNVPDLMTGVEVLASFGLIECRYELVDGSLPAVRFARPADPSTLKKTFEAACGVADCLPGLDLAAPLEVDALANQCGVSSEMLLDSLSLLHLVGAASVDLRSWEAGYGNATGKSSDPIVTHEIRILDVADRDAALAAAAAASLERARLTRLRLEALKRYATIESDEGGDAYQLYLERYLTEPDFLERIAAETTEALADGLTSRQRSIVDADTAAPIVILAGPGTGKTRTVVTRIACRVSGGDVLAERVLAVTFTRAATDETKARLAQVGVTGVNVRTLDSLAFRIVNGNWQSLGFSHEPKIADYARQIRTIEGIDPTANARRELQRIDLAKAKCEPLKDALHIEFQKRLSDQGLVTFNDLKARAVEFLGRPGDDARLYLEGVDEVYVDEFQDLSPLQIQLVDAIAQRAHLTVVGDPRQAIYVWNGADPEALIERAQTGNSFELTENFRSGQAILDLGNQVIAKTLSDLAPMQAIDPSRKCTVEKHGFVTDDDWTGHVCSTVRAWLNDAVPDSEVAVLARTNEHVRVLVNALRASGTPARGEGLARLSSTYAFDLLLRHADTDAHASDAVEDDAEVGESLVDAVDRIRGLDEIASLLVGADEDEGAENNADWLRLRDAIDEQQRQGAVTLSDALAGIAKGDDAPAERVGVVVTTMTRAKGLEWDAVAVAGVGADQMLDKLNEAESCRLLYVAITRARKHLDLSWTGQRTRWI